MSLGFSRQEHWSGLPFPSPMHESEKWKWSRSVVSDSLWPHGLKPTRLLHPWDLPGKSTGVGCHCFWGQTNLVKLRKREVQCLLPSTSYPNFNPGAVHMTYRACSVPNHVLHPTRIWKLPKKAKVLYSIEVHSAAQKWCDILRSQSTKWKVAQSGS